MPDREKPRPFLPLSGTDPPSLPGFVGALFEGAREAIRQNRLPASLSLLALAIVLPLALGARYDERPRYRQFILSEIERLEFRYRSAIDRAEEAPTPVWRTYHFIDAHRRAVDVLDYLESRRPVTATGRRAHQALIQYYELTDQHFAILRTEMSLKPDMDYLERWRQVTGDLEPLYRTWADWADGDAPGRKAPVAGMP